MLTENQLVQAFNAERNGAKFPIDFDETWQPLGYNKKSSAKRVILRYLVKSEDYIIVPAIDLMSENDVLALCPQEKASISRLEIIKLSESGYAKFNSASFQLANRKKKQTSQVYFIVNEARSAVKIGFSTDPESRLHQLEEGTIDDLKIIALFPGGRKEEALLHKKFAKFRIRREWFIFSDEIKNYIKAPLNVTSLKGKITK